MVLKANELRIGNIVRYYGNNNPLKIEHIDTRNRNGWLNGYIIEENSNCLNKTAISALEPIPLTSEWLINFGFEETDYAGGCYYLGSLQIDLSDFECAFKTNWLDCKVQYVHQLQNLYFAITGKELTHQKIN